MLDLSKYKDQLDLDIENLTVDQQRSWLTTISANLFDLDQIIDMTVMAQCGLLYYAYKNWNFLDRTITSEFNYDFFVWAKRFIKSNSKEPANTTIMNRITVYRDYISPEKDLKVPSMIAIDNNGSGKTLVQFHPEKVDFGKLLVARGAVRRENTDPAIWQALADPKVTVNQLKQVLTDKNAVNTDLGRRTNQFFYKDGILFIASETEIVGVFQLLTENSGYPAFIKALSYFGRVINVQFPTYLEDRSEHNTVAEVIDENLVLNDKLGTKFITFSDIADIELIRDVCDSILDKVA